MPSKRIFLACLFGFSIFLAFSQEIPVNYAVCDWSFGFFNSQPSDIDRIRGSVASFSSENSNKGLTSISFRGTTGLKYETLLLSNRIGLGAGIRYSQFVQNTGKWTLLSEGVNFFYFLYAQDDQKTYYARIKSILQTSSYLGIPAEFTFFPLENQQRYRFYMKMGAEIDFRVNTRTTIHFVNDEMSSMEPVIASHISSPSAAGFSFYNCFGIRAGTDGRPAFSIELLLPLLNTNPGSPGLLKNKFGGGLQFNYHIPIQSRN